VLPEAVWQSAFVFQIPHSATRAGLKEKRENGADLFFLHPCILWPYFFNFSPSIRDFVGCPKTHTTTAIFATDI
jgi:hypothetical protein